MNFTAIGADGIFCGNSEDGVSGKNSVVQATYPCVKMVVGSTSFQGVTHTGCLLVGTIVSFR